MEKPFNEIIAETSPSTIVAVYVKKLICNSPISFEITIKEKMAKHSKPFDYYSICYPEGKIPWPEPYINRVYLFLPPNPIYILAIDAHHLINDFDRVISALGKSSEEVEEIYSDRTEKIKESEVNTPNNMPSGITMAKNLFKQGWDSTRGFLEGKPVFAIQEVQQERLKICNSCDQFVDRRCINCGCFMEQKVKLEAATCPLNKW